MKYARTLLMLNVALLSTSIFATNNPHYYVSLGGGWSSLSKQTASLAEPATFHFNKLSKPGFLTSVAAGYAMKHINLGVELSIMRNQIDRVSLTQTDHSGPQPDSSSGSTSAIPLLLTSTYHVNFNKWAPYIGVGAGIARLDENITAHIPASYGQASIQEKTHSNAFAYAIMLGVKYHISAHILIGVGYKFLGTSAGYYTAIFKYAGKQSSTQYKEIYYNQSGMLSLSYLFK